MVYVIWVLVLVQYPMTYINKLCMILHPLNWKVLMLQSSLPIEILLHQLVLLEMLKSCVGRLNILLIFLFLVPPQDDFCPIIFGRPFLNTASARINCEKNIVTIGIDGMSHEFNLAKFSRQPREREPPSKDEIMVLLPLLFLQLIR